MVQDVRDLGGRVPLLDPAALDPAQKDLYLQALKTVVVLGDKAGYQTKTSDGRLIGPFNSMLLSPEISKAFLGLEKAEGEHTSLDKRTRQVVILTVGCVWNARYELYAHTAEGRAAGLDDATVTALSQGKPSDGLGDDERLAQRFTFAVLNDHRVEDDLFSAAQEAFGNKGVLDMLVLIGCYQTVCSSLNVFDVPVPGK